jgi:excisionase family DNA binding protein
MTPSFPSPVARDSGYHPAVLTVREVAEHLRCSKAHIHNLLNRKVSGTPPLPSIRIGRRRLILRGSLEEWLRSSERISE